MRKLDRNKEKTLSERMRLAKHRLLGIEQEQTASLKYQDYFQKITKIILQMYRLWDQQEQGLDKNKDFTHLKRVNRELYSDILPGRYETSYANPAYAAEKLGPEHGPLLAFLYKEIRGLIVYAYEQNLLFFTIYVELFLEIYGWYLEEIEPPVKEVKKCIYWFQSDYSDEMITHRLQEQYDEECDFALQIIQTADLTDLRYLFRFGEYITENEIKLAEHMNSLTQEEIEAMARTYTEGYRIGFEATGKDLSKKEIVNIRYHLGMERMIRAAIRQFADMGLRPAIFRQSVMSSESRIGYSGADANKQYLYDHREDRAIYLDRAYLERRLGALQAAYERMKETTCKFAGPACVETFGETPFAPMPCKEAFLYNEKQQKLAKELENESAQIVNKYIIGSERSFTIIAYPLPEIGEPFAEIFSEIVKINTLDYKLYQNMQQKLIDALDKGTRVRIKGRNGNKTDLTVQLHPLNNPEKETIFENCVADVNIPVGEVFTSPVLKGTNGILHVTNVFLNELEYKNLQIIFKDGKIEEYTCENFNSEQENKDYIRQNILMHHDTLPMGEFAIGTNTTAYVMAKKYDIAAKLPILIAEKMGPHFAVGDTCYSWQEDTAVFNPDGKEIIARDNEVSALRKENVSKAYLNCHTDITIPYDELDTITVLCADGSEILLIENGRFVLPGTEELNKPFDNE